MLAVVQAYRRAHKRLLLLDYDGTLAEFNADPMAATPNAELLDVLRQLVHDPANTVVVVSGRPGTTLEQWLGDLDLFFSAEHGFLHKQPGGRWESISSVDGTWDDKWKAPIRQLMERYTKLVPGAILEEKLSALTWHWRAAEDAEQAAQHEAALYSELKELAEPMELRVLRIVRGNKVIEVHPAGFDKGTAAAYWLGKGGYDFVLGAGDDTTDEDLFRALPSGGFSIKVGANDGSKAGSGAADTHAQFRLQHPAAMRAFLHELATANSRHHK